MGFAMTGAGFSSPSRCAIVTNIPTPYRNPIYSLLPHDRFLVIFCGRTEGNRQWHLPTPNFQHEFLVERSRAKADGFNYVHNNPDVWAALSHFGPRVVVTTGFNPTHLYAFLWAKRHGAHHVCMTDGTLLSEANLSWRHRAVRRLAFRHSKAFIAASRGGVDLFRSYQVPKSDVFISRLCADNERFTAAAFAHASWDYDVMFSGRLHESKLPFLFVDVCRELKARRGQCRALLLGDGPLRAEVLAALETAGVQFNYPGFVQPADLPTWYARARVFLFPTRLDAWGVVANEALASGIPVITTPQAGVAGDLVIHGHTGFVLPPDASQWADAACALLDNPALWAALSAAGQTRAAEYNYRSAADGIVAACAHAASESKV
jgi:glycosyltransferase involved in cell wall biosynthesis